MTRKVAEKLCTKKVCVEILAPKVGEIAHMQKYKLVNRKIHC